MRLAKKSMIVTGGGAGIGRAIAERAAAEGACIAIIDCDRRQGASAARRIEKAGGTARSYVVDVSDEARVRQCIDEIDQELGGIDVLVNNAAISVIGTILECDAETWQKAFSVNVMGYVNCARYVIPKMGRKKRGGSIINTVSSDGFRGGPGGVVYNTTKGAVVQLTRSLACDHAADNIRVNGLVPNVTETRMLRDCAREAGVTPAEFASPWTSRNFIKRLGKPGELANAAIFLASDESSFTTGTFLFVDGGVSAA